MKKIIAALVVLFSFTATSAQSYENVPTIAILDTAIDSSLPIFQGKIVHEVCILDWPSCPNGDYYMEGSGSAVLGSQIISRNGFSHGTQMASAVILTNPNVNIVFIRIISHNSSGFRLPTSEQNIAEALNWVAENKDLYNIQAVSMSQGHHKLLYYRQYCPLSKILKPSIYNLKQLGIPVFFPTGNNSDPDRIDWPSCIEDAIAVGATDIKNSIASYSNRDPNLVDFYSLGEMKLYTVGNKMGTGRGTSIAAQVAAAQWLAVKSAKPNLTYQEIYDLLSRTSKTAKGKNMSFGKLINIGAAING